MMIRYRVVVIVVIASIVVEFLFSAFVFGNRFVDHNQNMENRVFIQFDDGRLAMIHYSLSMFRDAAYYECETSFQRNGDANLPTRMQYVNLEEYICKRGHGSFGNVVSAGLPFRCVAKCYDNSGEKRYVISGIRAIANLFIIAGIMLTLHLLMFGRRVVGVKNPIVVAQNLIGSWHILRKK